MRRTSSIVVACSMRRASTRGHRPPQVRSAPGNNRLTPPGAFAIVLRARGASAGCRCCFQATRAVPRSGMKIRACSSVGEHHLDTVGVVGSIPTTHTISSVLRTERHPVLTFSVAFQGRHTISSVLRTERHPVLTFSVAFQGRHTISSVLRTERHPVLTFSAAFQGDAPFFHHRPGDAPLFSLVRLAFELDENAAAAFAV